MNGGAGTDVLTGGSGNDHFVFNMISDSQPNAQRDHITDFAQGADLVDVSGIDAIDGGSDDAFTFIGNDVMFTNSAGQLRAYHSGGHTVIEGDVTGNGSADFQIELDTNVLLTSADFVL